MSLLEIILIGVGLAMDAFAVSICKGLTMKKFNIKKGIIIASYFGIFQACMPLLGYALGINFASAIEKIDRIRPALTPMPARCDTYRTMALVVALILSKLSSHSMSTHELN